MNELLLLLHLLTVGIFGLFAEKLGKEALTAWIALLALLANFFVLKQIALFGLNATASDVFAIASLFSLNRLQERFGWQASQRAISLSFFLLLFFGIMSQVHLLYAPSSCDFSQPSYSTLLSPSPRLFLASLISFFIFKKIDSFLYEFLKKKWEGKQPAMRNLLPLFFSQFLDTLLFTILGLWGIVSHLGEILLFSFAIKIVMVLFFVPLGRVHQYILSSLKTER